VVLVISFSAAAFLKFPPPGFSLQWYRRMFAAAKLAAPFAVAAPAT
jgi:ABC-type spermidine/putrescine transport system permease subunit II